MKPIPSLAIATLMLVSGANAFAQTPSSGLTRAEVHTQLVQAEKNGILPSSKLDYPPSAETIARNKELYDIRHEHDHADATAAVQQDTNGMNGDTN
jgi:hypothetical protein